MNILTQQIVWKEQLSTLINHNFVYHDFNCTASELSAVCLINNIDIIICGDYKIQSHFGARFAKEIHTLQLPWLIPSYFASEMENKFKFQQWLCENNFLTHIPLQKNLSDFPYLLKTGNSYGGKHVYIIKSKSDLDTLGFKPENTPYICQQYIHANHELSLIHI